MSQNGQTHFKKVSDHFETLCIKGFRTSKITIRAKELHVLETNELFSSKYVSIDIFLLIWIWSKS